MLLIRLSNPNSPAVKMCAASKKAIVKKDVKSKVAAKKWLDGRLMAKFLIMTIRVNLCCLLHISLGFGTHANSPELLLLNFCH